MTPPLATIPADAADNAWFLLQEQQILAGLLDGTITGCPHVRDADVIICAVVESASAVCPGCWEPPSLAERCCDLCGKGRSVGWVGMALASGVPMSLIASICDACETVRIFGQPAPGAQDDGR